MHFPNVPETDGAGRPIIVQFKLYTRLGPTLLRIMESAEPGLHGVVPNYIPSEWLNRLVLEIDAAGQHHFLWTGWNNGEGHGKVREDGQIKYTHRAVVERVLKRKLNRFEYVDHKADICGRKPCCTFEHLEPVPPGVNTARGPGSRYQFKTSTEYLQEVRAEYGEPLDALG